MLTKTLMEFDEVVKRGGKYKEALEKIFIHLGIKDKEAIKSYLKPSLKDFNDPSLMKDMDIALEVISKTIDENGRIILFSDYDADGVTSAALFVKVLRHMGYDNFDYFIPDRQKDGYGVSKKNLEKVSKEADLIITSDTGIREINSIKNNPVPVIVTDHHEPITGEYEDLMKSHPNGVFIKKETTSMVIPDAKAVINPRRIDCDYPNECLAGVGVLYKMFQGLFKKRGLPIMELLVYLDLVAVGTVADLVPQFDAKYQDTENRLITALGLQMMNNDPDTWLKSFKVIHRKQKIEFNDLGFSIGPNLNAASRMGSAYPAVNFLTEEDSELSLELCAGLKDINEDRKRTQREAADSVDFEKDSSRNIVVTVLNEKYDTGVAGLVASELSDKNKSPAIVFCVKEVDGEKLLTGSCRSIDGVSIIDALTKTEKKIGTFRYGGHKQAAGLTIKENDYEDFKEEIIKIMNNVNMDSLRGELSFDIELPLCELDHDVVGLLNSSYVNVKLISRNNIMYSPPTPLKNPKWSRLFLDSRGERYQAMLWKNSEEVAEEYQNNNINSIDIVYQASFFNGNISISINNFIIN